jgi:hypothetical protein
MLEEVCRREKEENIIPDPDIDVYMKVRVSIVLNSGHNNGCSHVKIVDM